MRVHPLPLTSSLARFVGSSALRIQRRDVHSYQFNQRPPKDKEFNAFISFTPHPENTKPGPLSGHSVAIKDNICTSAFPTTCSSRILKDFTPGYNATVVDLLEKAGAHVAGKTNCDEFGMGSLNMFSFHGPVMNPFQLESDHSSWPDREPRVAGGSSGGSAAAVASKQCFAALSTDTGGSTRLPASYCGVVGLKPSYGLLSRWGVVSFADSLDTVGITASSVHDVRRVFNVVSHFDDKDPTSIPPDLRAQARTVCSHQIESRILSGKDQLHGLRVGIPQEYFPAELEPSLLEPFRMTLSHLKTLGAMLVPVSMPSTQYALSAYYVLASAEASSNMARYDGIRYGTHATPPEDMDKTRTSVVYAQSRSHGFGLEVQKRILLGTYALTADAFDNYFLQAQRLRALVRADFDHVFRIPNVLSCASAVLDPHSAGVDVLVHLSAIRTAPRLSEALSQGLDTYVQDALTVPASLAGVPAVSVPVGYAKDGWPVGVSVVSQWGCEEMVLKVGEAMESACS